MGKTIAFCHDICCSDGTVPLVSLGLMGAAAWRHSHWNPHKTPVLVREFKHEPNPKLERGGPATADHVDILGNAEMLTDILNIVTGQDVLVQERYYTNMPDVGQQILKRIDERAELERNSMGSTALASASETSHHVKKWMKSLFKHSY